MKFKSTLRNACTLFAVSMGTGLLLPAPGYATGWPANELEIVSNGPGEEEPAKKSKSKSKSFSSRNNSSVKIYPDVMKRLMHVVAKENEGKSIDFFVFNLDGTLLHNYKMKAGDHIKIVGLAKGSYVYRVFNGDTETASGNFEIR